MGKAAFLSKASKTGKVMQMKGRRAIRPQHQMQPPAHSTAARVKQRTAVRGHGVSAQPNGSTVHHGSAARIRPGTSLHPRNFHMEVLGQGNQKHLKGVYVTGNKNIASTSSVFVHPKGYRYNITKKKGHDLHTPQDHDPRLGGPRNPKLEAMSRRRMKPKTVTQVKVDASKLKFGGVEMKDGLPINHTKGFVNDGHTYPNRGRKLQNGNTSKLAHDNLPSHTSAQSTRPVGTTPHSVRGRASRRHTG